MNREDVLYMLGVNETYSVNSEFIYEVLKYAISRDYSDMCLAGDYGLFLNGDILEEKTIKGEVIYFLENVY